RERRGRNPQTGDDLQITARKVVVFKPSNIIKDIVERVNV
ncbi:MAG: HU family DNA-binding protein, partial [Thermodesulfovibrionales bacterium]